MTKAILISIGDELLYGQTLDTNAHWISGRLSELGFSVVEHRTIRDEPWALVEALDYALSRADLVTLTGGLGPTSDDKTKQTLADYFGMNLRFDEQVYEDIRHLFARRSLALLERNRQQAMVPDGCRVIRNPRGTAPGMWFERDGKIIVSMPGVPTEMKGMMEADVLPWLKAFFHLPVIAHAYVLTAGMGESKVAELLTGFESTLPENIKLAYLPGQGIVKLRLTATGNDRVRLEQELKKYQTGILEVLRHIAFSTDPDDTLEKVAGDLLRTKGLTLVTAESCTGGKIAHKITSVPGSSDYFLGTVVAYSNEVKRKILGVKEGTLQAHGAVSEPVVHEMLQGVCRTLGGKVGIAVSGIAGPGGGTPEKPVGTVWMAVGTAGNIHTRKFNLPGQRHQVIEWASVIALNFLRRFLLGTLER